LHDEVAEYLFGKGFNKEQKMIAKNINFGIVYGISAFGLMDQIEIGAHRLGSDIHVTKEQAQQWINGWFERFPEAAQFIDKCKQAPIKGWTLVTPFGRKRRFGVVSREKLKDLQNEAANFPEQSSAHDITLLAGIELAPELADDYDCRPVNEVHDAILNEIPDDMSLIIPAARRIKEVLERIPTEWGLDEIPFLAEAEIGFAWGTGTKFDPYKYDPRELKGISHVEVIQKA
jgi:DNA polymerase-1